MTIDTLPPLHKDPFDRILVVQAMVESITLLTSGILRLFDWFESSTHEMGGLFFVDLMVMDSQKVRVSREAAKIAKKNTFMLGSFLRAFVPSCEKLLFYEIVNCENLPFDQQGD